MDLFYKIIHYVEIQFSTYEQNKIITYSYSLGYIYGCGVAASHLMHLENSESEITIILTIFKELFGQYNGTQLWGKSSKLVREKDKEFLSGLSAGKSDVLEQIKKDSTFGISLTTPEKLFKFLKNRLGPVA
jgi:hypothetical protein